jgi:flagellar L-ring protein precursor FlgH
MTADRPSPLTRVLLAAALTALAAVPVAAQAPPVAPDTHDQAMARLLASREAAVAGAAPWMYGLGLDLRARRLNDIVTVRVEEAISASGSADASLGKSSGSSVAVPSFFGLETKLPSIVDPSNLASSQAETTFKGGGTTTRASVLSAIISARVAAVLPNGDLMIEGVREIAINGDRQMVVLTGIARVVDIGPANVISSTALGQLQIRYFGNGLTKTSLSPGWLVRLLNRIF